MSFANPHFAEPGWLWLAVLGPLVLLALQRYAARARRRQLRQVAAPALAAELTRGHSPARRVVKDLLLVAALAGFGIALARPQWGEQAQASRLLGRDTLFIIDCSRSMLASDIAPNRLQRTKLAVTDFVQHRGQGRVGLVAFAGQAFLQCPLTYDYGAFEEALSALDDKTIPIAGTDIGRALEEGVHALDKKSGQKTLILLTDGEDLEKSGVKMAESLAKQGVVIFCVGVGTPAGAEVQIINEQGRPELLRDSKGETVRSRLDEPTLRAIAQATRGTYNLLGPLGEGLAKVRQAVDTFEFGAGAQASKKLGVDRFHLPVAGVLVLLVLESLLGTRRRRNAPELALVALLLCCCNVSAAEPSPAPSNPREFFNAGTVKLRENKLREAEAMLESVLSSQEERLQPPALYNLGHVRFAAGKEELKKGPAAKTTSARSRAASQAAENAMRAADDALAGDDLQKMIDAYMRGRAARKELKAAATAVKRALETYAAALNKWQRAAADFRSALELNPADEQARRNAEIVEQCIARLIDSIREMQPRPGAMGSQQQQLRDKLKELRGRIPEPDMPPGAAGDEEEEEENPSGPPPGQSEGPGKEGEEMSISPEQAGWLLDSFKLDGNRRLPMGGDQPAQPRDRSRPTW